MDKEMTGEGSETRQCRNWVLMQMSSDYLFVNLDLKGPLEFSQLRQEAGDLYAHSIGLSLDTGYPIR